MKKLARSIFATLGVLALMVCTACGAPQAPSASTAVPASAQPFSTATAAPSVTPLASPTQAATMLPATPSATPTAVSTSTIVPRIDPAPSLSLSEPALLFPTSNGLAIVNQDGTDKTLLGISSPSFEYNLGRASAPRAGLLAIIIGDDPFTPEPEGCCVLTLNILNVPSNTLRAITPLFSAEIEQAIRTATATGDRNDAIEAAIAVIDNSDTLKWSPDGRYLAFIAAIDGPSSDVYSYDLQTGQINRLTDGPNQAARLFWSPDSQWIVHEEVESFGTGAGWNVKAVWAAAPDGNTTRKLYNAGGSGDEVFVDWISPDIFIVYSWTPVGLQNIRLIDLASGAAHRIGPEFPVQAYAVDPKSRTQLYVVDDYTAQQNSVMGGLYLDVADPIGALSKRVSPGNWYEVHWLPHAQLFFARGESGVISVALNGTTKEYSGESALPIDSPDGVWLLAWGDGNYTNPIGLRLYTADGDLKRTITQDAVTLAMWSPDSDGVFYVSDGKLYYVAPPNGEPQLLEENLTTTEAGSMGWVQP